MQRGPPGAEALTLSKTKAHQIHEYVAERQSLADNISKEILQYRRVCVNYLNVYSNERQHTRVAGRGMLASFFMGPCFLMALTARAEDWKSPESIGFALEIMTPLFNSMPLMQVIVRHATSKHTDEVMSLHTPCTSENC